MKYTVEQYQRCLQVARNVIECINEVQCAMADIQNGYGWREFGESLDKVFDAKYAYEKVLSSCCVEAYEKEINMIENPCIKCVLNYDGSCCGCDKGREYKKKLEELI